MSKLNIFALGGLDENGKNLYCVEIDDRILVVNAGIMYPESNQFGVQAIIPDYSYLVKNKERIVGVILTHAHDDMMDGLPYLLNEINLPVYGPKLCHKALKHLMNPDCFSKLKFTSLPRNGVTNINGINVHSFGLTHAIPDSIGIAIETENGQIVIAEQFVIDFDMHDKGFDCDINKIAEIGKNDVLCLMLESSYADKDQFTSPHHKVYDLIRPTFEDAKGRIIVSIYNQNYYRLKEILKLAKEFKRSVLFYDPVLRNKLNDLENLDYFSIPSGIEINRDKFSNDYDDVVIIITENGGKIFNVLNRIATGEDSLIELKESDTVIITSPVVSGIEKKASAMENELYKDNVSIVKLNAKEVLSMHPSSEDIKMMLNLLKPKYFLPVMGEYRNFVSAGNLAMKVGYTPDRIIILDNGQVATFDKGFLTSCSTFIDVDDVMVGGKDDENIASFVLKDRETLSTDGVIIIGIAINYNTKEVIGGPDIQSRGVIYVKDSEHVIKNVGKMAIDLIEENVANGTYNNMNIRADLREMAAKYVLRETGKRPMILPAIIEINV